MSIAAGLAWLLALRRRPYRRDLVWLGALLPLGVIGQAVLGGFTVKGALDYGWVMGHFALSMLILLAAVLLAWRAAHEPDELRAGVSGDRLLVRSLRGLVALGALTIFAGTAATAAGPHAGGSPGQKINRLDFDGRGTMDFVIHRHAEIALVFSLAAVAVWWLARRRSTDPVVQRPLTVLCVLLAAAGRRGARPVRDPPADRARLGARRARLLRLADRLWSACAAGRLAGPRVNDFGRTAPGGPLRARRAAQVPRKLGLFWRPDPAFAGVVVLASG